MTIGIISLINYLSILTNEDSDIFYFDGEYYHMGTYKQSIGWSYSWILITIFILAVLGIFMDIKSALGAFALTLVINGVKFLLDYNNDEGELGDNKVFSVTNELIGTVLLTMFFMSLFDSVVAYTQNNYVPWIPIIYAGMMLVILYVASLFMDFPEFSIIYL